MFKVTFYLSTLTMLKACSVPTMQLHADYDTETKKSHYSPLGDLRIQRFFDGRPNIQKTALKRYFKKNYLQAFSVVKPSLNYPPTYKQRCEP